MFNDSQVTLGVRTYQMTFYAPPLNSPLPNFYTIRTRWETATNVAATVSQMLRTPDLPLWVGTHRVHANIGCYDGHQNDPDIPVTDSCSSRDSYR